MNYWVTVESQWLNLNGILQCHVAGAFTTASEWWVLCVSSGEVRGGDVMVGAEGSGKTSVSPPMLGILILARRKHC